MRDDQTDQTVEGLVSAKDAEEQSGEIDGISALTGILVVEADPDLQWRMARMLTVQGNRVVGTSTGEGALALIAQWPVDLVLIDEDLPGMDGLELIRRLSQGTNEITLVLLTDGSDPDLEVAARLAGATCCIEKPFHAEALQPFLLGRGTADFDATAAE